MISRVIDGGYCEITSPYTDEHGGVDVVALRAGNRVTSRILAHSDGVVVDVRKNCPGYEDNHSYGNFVLIKHPVRETFMYTRYAHLAYGTVRVNVGDRVCRGDILGYMGDSGYAFGAHLHFEVLTNTMFKIDPTSYLNRELPYYDTVIGLSYDCIQKEWLPAVISAGSPADTIGNPYHELGGIAVSSPTLKSYCARSVGDKYFLPPVSGFNINDFPAGFAGNLLPICDIAINDPHIAYQVKLLSTQEWLPVVYGKDYDLNDYYNGYAGDGEHAIDEVKIWRV